MPSSQVIMWSLQAESEDEWAEPPSAEAWTTGDDESMSIGDMETTSAEETENYDSHFDMDTEQKQWVCA